jgi:hypothetical protein
VHDVIMERAHAGALDDRSIIPSGHVTLISCCPYMNSWFGVEG